MSATTVLPDIAGMHVLNPSLTVEEIARVSLSHKETVLRAVRTGDLPAGRVGKNYVISARDAQTWLAARGIHNVVCATQEIGK